MSLNSQPNLQTFDAGFVEAYCWKRFLRVVKFNYCQTQVLLWLVAILFVALPVGSPAQAERFFVPPLENISGKREIITYSVATGTNPNNPQRSFRVDRYSEVARGIIEDTVINLGGEVVERQRVDQMLLEIEFGRVSGLIDQSTAVELGRMLGAQYIVMGTIEDVSSEQNKFSGYGVRTTTSAVKATVRVRVFSIELGRVIFSRRLRGSQSFFSSQYSNVVDNSAAINVIERALEQLSGDREFLALISG